MTTLRNSALASVLLCLAACSNPEQAARDYYQKGEAAFARKEYQEAIVELRNALQQDAKFGEARLKLAQAYEATGDSARAFREFVRAADLLPDNNDAQMSASSYLLLAGQFEDAQTRVQKVLDRDPTNVQAQIVKGSAMAGLKDLDGAVKQIEEAIKVDPNRGLTYTNLGFLKAASGDRAAALEAFEKAVQLAPRSIPALLSLANFHFAVGDIPSAEKVLKDALAVDPKHSTANRMLAAVYVSTNRVPEAEAPLKALAESGGQDATLSLADYYLNARRWNDAKAVLTPLRDTPAAFAGAESRLAQIEYLNGDKANAHKMLDGVIAKEATNAEVLYLKARWLGAEGKRTEALTQAEAAVKANPNLVAGHYLIGSLHATARENDQAIAAFTEVLRLNPRVAGAQLELSRLQLASGAADKAVQLAEQAVQSSPDSAVAKLALARAFVAERDLSRAEPAVAALLKQYPEEARVQALDGSLRLLKKDLAGARNAYERANKLNEQLFEPVAGLVSLDMLQKDVKGARRRLDQQLVKAPNDANLLLLSARVSMVENDAARAEQALKKVIEVAPSESMAYGLLGQVYLAQGKLDAAVTEFDGLARKNPKDIASRTMSALIAHSQQKVPEAKTKYQEILDIDPNATVAANNLAWILADTGGDLDEALKLAQRAAVKEADRAEIQDTLGWIYYKKQLPALAIKPFERSVASSPDNPTYHYHLGMAYAGSGDREKARRSLDAALRLKPDLVEAQQLRATLRN